MAFSFGLLHGLGFAGALSDIGIANDQMLLSLLFFNIGIELAQIALIPIPLILIYIASKVNFQNYLQVAASFCIGGMGFYWFIDLSLIHISEPTRRRGISYAVFCLKKKK